jgi:hypothetical protein
MADYNVWRANYGRTAGTATGSSLDLYESSPAVPEPTTLVPFILAAAALSARRTPNRWRDPNGLCQHS